MPTDQNTQAKHLEPILRGLSGVSPEVKDKIWDTFFSTQDQAAFRGALESLPVDKAVKRQMWFLKNPDLYQSLKPEEKNLGNPQLESFLGGGSSKTVLDPNDALGPLAPKQASEPPRAAAKAAPAEKAKPTAADLAQSWGDYDIKLPNLPGAAKPNVVPITEAQDAAHRAGKSPASAKPVPQKQAAAPQPAPVAAPQMTQDELAAQQAVQAAMLQSGPASRQLRPMPGQPLQFAPATPPPASAMGTPMPPGVLGPARPFFEKLIANAGKIASEVPQAMGAAGQSHSDGMVVPTRPLSEAEMGMIAQGSKTANTVPILPVSELVSDAHPYAKGALERVESFTTPMSVGEAVVLGGIGKLAPVVGRALLGVGAATAGGSAADSALKVYGLVKAGKYEEAQALAGSATVDGILALFLANATRKAFGKDYETIKSDLAGVRDKYQAWRQGRASTVEGEVLSAESVSGSEPPPPPPAAKPAEAAPKPASAPTGAEVVPSSVSTIEKNAANIEWSLKQYLENAKATPEEGAGIAQMVQQLETMRAQQAGGSPQSDAVWGNLTPLMEQAKAKAAVVPPAAAPTPPPAATVPPAATTTTQAEPPPVPAKSPKAGPSAKATGQKKSASSGVALADRPVLDIGLPPVAPEVPVAPQPEGPTPDVAGEAFSLTEGSPEWAAASEIQNILAWAGDESVPHEPQDMEAAAAEIGAGFQALAASDSPAAKLMLEHLKQRAYQAGFTDQPEEPTPASAEPPRVAAVAAPPAKEEKKDKPSAMPKPAKGQVWKDSYGDTYTVHSVDKDGMVSVVDHAGSVEKLPVEDFAKTATLVSDPAQSSEPPRVNTAKSGENSPAKGAKLETTSGQQTQSSGSSASGQSLPNPPAITGTAPPNPSEEPLPKPATVAPAKEKAEPAKTSDSMTVENFNKRKAAGTGYSRFIELVPTSELEKFAEYDRAKEEKYPGHFEEVLKDVEQNGIKNELILKYDPKTGKSLLGEGNTRLAAAKRLGIKAVPVRVLRSSVDGPKGASAPSKYEGRAPEDISPAEIGLGTPAPAAKPETNRDLPERRRFINRGKHDRVLVRFPAKEDSAIFDAVGKSRRNAEKGGSWNDLMELSGNAEAIRKYDMSGVALRQAYADYHEAVREIAKAQPKTAKEGEELEAEVPSFEEFMAERTRVANTPKPAKPEGPETPRIGTAAEVMGEAARPIVQLRKVAMKGRRNVNGWWAHKFGEGVLLIHPTEDKVVSYQDKDQAFKYATDNPVGMKPTAEPPKPKAVESRPVSVSVEHDSGEGIPQEVIDAYRAYEEIDGKYHINQASYDRSKSDNIKLGQRWKKLAGLIEKHGLDETKTLARLARMAEPPRPTVGRSEPQSAPVDKMAAAREARVNNLLDTQVRTKEHGVITWRDYIHKTIDAGGRVEKVMADDPALRRKLQAEYDQMNRGFNIPWGNEKHPKTIAATELKNRLAGDIQSPEYRMYKGRDGDTWTVIDKTKFDYASGVAEKKTETPAVQEARTTEKAEQPKESYDYSSTQYNLPEKLALRVRSMADEIDPADVESKETEPHVTVLYGLHGDNADALRALLADQPPIKAVLGSTSVFPASESGSSDVVKIDVGGPDLHALNKKIADALPHTSTYPTYQPHITVAYVEAGAGQKYAGDDRLAGKEITIDQIVFSGKNGDRVVIPLAGKPPEAPKANPPAKPEGSSEPPKPKQEVKAEPPKAAPKTYLSRTMTKVKTTAGREVRVEPRISEAADLITSFEGGFPQELQPRNTNRAGSRQRIDQRKGDMDPENMAESYNAGDGAPITWVSPEGKRYAATRNHGLKALKEIYAEGTDRAKAYRQWVIDNAERLGSDPGEVAKMKQPVFHRDIAEEMAPEDIVAMAEEANVSSVAHLSSSEWAQMVARRITPAMLQEFEPSPDGTPDYNFIRNIIKGLTVEQQAYFQDSNGKPSSDGVRIIRNAVFAKAYNSPAAIERMTEVVNSDIANLTSGMMRAAAAFARLGGAIDAGSLHPVSIASELADAAEIISQLRKTGERASDWLAQVDMFGRDPIVERLVGILNELTRKPRQLGEFLNAYADMAAHTPDPRQSGMFGDSEPPNRSELIDAAYKEAILKPADEKPEQLGLVASDGAGADQAGSGGEAAGGVQGEAEAGPVPASAEAEVSPRAGQEPEVDPPPPPPPAKKKASKKSAASSEPPRPISDVTPKSDSAEPPRAESAEEEAPRVYRIPEQNVEQLQDRLEKLSRRAVKLGMSPITLREVGRHAELYSVSPSGDKTRHIPLGKGETAADAMKRDEAKYSHLPAYLQPRYFTADVIHYEVDGASPKLNGWQFAGVIEHTEHGNILRIVPPFNKTDIPAKYRRATTDCEHCNTDRDRKQTYVVKSDGGDFKQVGKSCLKDFTGHADPNSIASLAEALSAFEEELRTPSESSSYIPSTYPIQKVLEVAAAVSRIDGFRSKASAAAYNEKVWANYDEESGKPAMTVEATYSTVHDILTPPDNKGRDAAYRRKLWEEKVEKYAPTEADKKTAQDAMAWAQALPEDASNDYLWNLKVASQMESIGWKHLGLTVSMVNAHAKATGADLKRAAKENARPSEYFGTPGKRAEFTLTLKSIKSFDGDFGTRHLYRFEDAEGNAATWWSNTSADMTQGSAYRVKATVKAHEDYKGTKQTILQRVTVLGDAAASAEPPRPESAEPPKFQLAAERGQPFDPKKDAKNIQFRVYSPEWGSDEPARLYVNEAGMRFIAAASAKGGDATMSNAGKTPKGAYTASFATGAMRRNILDLARQEGVESEVKALANAIINASGDGYVVTSLFDEDEPWAVRRTVRHESTHHATSRLAMQRGRLFDYEGEGASDPVFRALAQKGIGYIRGVGYESRGHEMLEELTSWLVDGGLIGKALTEQENLDLLAMIVDKTAKEHGENAGEQILQYAKRATREQVGKARGVRSGDAGPGGVRDQGRQGAAGGDQGRTGQEAAPSQEPPRLKIDPANPTGQQIVNTFMSAELLTAKKAAEIIGNDKPEYLNTVADFILKQRQKLLAGEMTPRDIAKAYFMTVASQGSSEQTLAATEANLNFKIPQEFTFERNGRTFVRPEEAAAAWLFTPMGQRALNAIERGVFDEEAWRDGANVRVAFGDDRFKNLNALGEPKGKSNTMQSLTRLTKAINASEGDMSKVAAALSTLNGIGAGKLGFIKHLVGIGDSPTIDSVAVNFWLTGKGSIGSLTSRNADIARLLKDTGSKKVVGEAVLRRITRKIDSLRAEIPAARAIPQEVFRHVMHHWIWDKAKGTETTHAGMMDAQMRAMLQGEPPPIKPTFYSALQRAVEAKMPNTASAEQIRAIVTNPNNAVKKEELAWSGLEDWLKDKSGKVSKQEVLDYLKANEVKVEEVLKRGDAEPVVKYDVPGTSGGTFSTREDAQRHIDRMMALSERWPELKEQYQRSPLQIIERKEPGEKETKYSQYALPGRGTYRELLLTLPPKKYRHKYQSAHWDEPNVLAHVRFNDKTDADKKRVLFIEEVQSDWHQEGKKQGYINHDEPFVVFDPMTGKEVKRFSSMDDAEGYVDENPGLDWDNEVEPDDRRFAKVPDAPFKDSWEKLALRRMIRWAAEEGFDRIAWVTGDIAADRFDISKQISRVEYSDDGVLTAYEPPPDETMAIGREVLRKKVSERELPDYIGKEAAEKLLAQPMRPYVGYKLLQGVDLKVGGEGMRAAYDKRLVNIANDIGKKFGAKVGDTFIQTGKQPLGFLRVHSMDITPAMRRSVLYEGQPMFMLPSEPPRVAKASTISEVDKTKELKRRVEGLYRSRTSAIANGTASPDDLDPAYRVSRSDTASLMGDIGMDQAKVVDNLEFWDGFMKWYKSMSKRVDKELLRKEASSPF